MNKWNEAAKIYQGKVKESMAPNNMATLKANITVRFVNMTDTKFSKLLYKHLHQIVQTRGIITSIGKVAYPKMEQEFKCSKCKETEKKIAVFEQYYDIAVPTVCNNENCNGSMLLKPDGKEGLNEGCHKTQEIVIAPDGNDGKNSNLVHAVLERDLVGCCQLGDDVIVAGTMKARQRHTPAGKKATTIFVIKVNSIRRQRSFVETLNEDQRNSVRDLWKKLLLKKGELAARDILVQSFCPDMYSLALPKLAILLGIASCADNEYKRTQSHILLVGTPALAKSKLLQRAISLSAKSHFACGYRVSKAGLTGGLVKGSGRDRFEAGLLPQCDGGICAIDEFNLMDEQDKLAIHESMEQQTVSLYKVR